MSPRDSWLTLLLRLCAVVLLLALVPALMPFRWMMRIHEAVGLGELPETALNHYLTRSLSLLYAFHGAFMLLLSFDVRRYRPLIRYLGVGNILFGGFMLGLDLTVGMPLWWSLGEGPFIIGAGVLIFWLAKEERPASGG